MNDLDSTRTRRLYGTKPMGLEVQCLLWTYSTGTPLEDAVFVKYTIINKGKAQIDSMYLGYWSDVDLGDANDDLVGFDSTLDMAYGYNGLWRDGVYKIPPAVGYVLLQGPVISSSADTAVFAFKRRSGWKNLPITAFPLIAKSNPRFGDPHLGKYEGAIHTFRALRGFATYTGEAFIDPATGKQTKLVYAGDPVTRTGWIDGSYYAPGDRRMMFGSGPTMLAPGDTQEILFATIVAQGFDRLHSIIELRKAAGSLHNIYSLYPLPSFEPPVLKATVSYPTASRVRIHIEGRIANVQTVTARLVTKNHDILDRFLLQKIGPDSFSGTWESNRQPLGVDIDVELSGNEYHTVWPVTDCVPLSGEIATSVYRIESDHLNFDGRANPGEHLRVSVEVKNKTPFPLGPLQLLDDQNQRLNIPYTYIRDPIPPGSKGHQRYSPFDSTTFMETTISENIRDGLSVPVSVILRDTSNSCWCSSFSIPVHEFSTQPIEGLTEHVSGPAYGTLGWRLVNSFELKDHTYRITISGLDSSIIKLVSITDLDEGRTHVHDYPLPDDLAHAFPVTDGWKLTIGTVLNQSIESELGVETPYEPPENQWLFSTYPFTSGKNFFGSALTYFDHVPVLIVFDSVRTQKAYRYVRGGFPSYGYTGYFDAPFQVFDVSDTTRPRQLNVAFTEDISSPRANERWDPEDSADREYLFIFKSSYSSLPQTFYTSKIISAEAGDMDILYAGWHYRSTSGKTFRNGDRWFLLPTIPVTHRDTFYLNPVKEVDRIYTGLKPETVTIHSLYPNPYSGADGFIRLNLTLGERQTIRVYLYDLFGRFLGNAFEQEIDRGTYIIKVAVPPSIPSGVFLLHIATTHRHLIRKIAIVR